MLILRLPGAELERRSMMAKTGFETWRQTIYWKSLSSRILTYGPRDHLSRPELQCRLTGEERRTRPLEHRIRGILYYEHFSDVFQGASQDKARPF